MKNGRELQVDEVAGRSDVWVEVDASRLSVEEIRSISERHKQEHPNLLPIT